MSFIERWKQKGRDLIHSTEKSLIRANELQGTLDQKLGDWKSTINAAPQEAVKSVFERQPGIRYVEQDVSQLSRKTFEKYNWAYQEMLNMKALLQNIERAKIINFATEQAKLFWSTPSITGQDFSLMRSPYPIIYCQIGPEPFVLHDYYDEENDAFHKEVRLMGAMITDSILDPQHRLFQTTLFIPLENYPENIYMSTFVVHASGLEDYHKSNRFHLLPLKDPDKAQKYFEQKYWEITNWTVHILNYLTSPSIELEPKQHSLELQKSRQRKGKEPLPGWYEITYKKSHVAFRQTSQTAEGYHHSFRYDVRGHFMHFKKGRMKGRVIWCPQHQRGLAHELYKPKTYRVRVEEPPPNVVASGSSKSF